MGTPAPIRWARKASTLQWLSNENHGAPSHSHIHAHTHTRARTQVGLWECVKQRKTPAEYYQRYALLMVMLCEVQSCSTQTPAAAALYSNGTTRHQHAVSWFLLDSAPHSFCLCLFFSFFPPPKLSQLSTPAASHFLLPSSLYLSPLLVMCAALLWLLGINLWHITRRIKGRCMWRKVYKYS